MNDLPGIFFFQRIQFPCHSPEINLPVRYLGNPVKVAIGAKAGTERDM